MHALAALVLFLTCVATSQSVEGSHPLQTSRLARRSALATGEPSQAEKTRVRKAILELSLKDADAVTRLLAMFQGKADARLGVEAGLRSVWRRQISWWAFGELILHEIPGDQYGRILEGARHLRSYGFMDPDPIRGERIQKRWTEERAKALLPSLDQAEPSGKADLLHELLLFSFLGYLPHDTRVKCEQYLPPLVSSQDLELRKLGLELLHELMLTTGDEGVLVAIRKAWKDPDPELRFLAWCAGLRIPGLLGEGRRSARKGLRSEDPAIRDAALRALTEARRLEKRDVDRLTPALLKTLEGQDQRVILRSLDALSMHPWGSANPPAEDWSTVLQKLVTHPNPAVRRKIPALLLHRLPSTPQAWTTLFQLLDDKDAEVIIYALQTVSEFEWSPSLMAGLAGAIEPGLAAPRTMAIRRILEISKRSPMGPTEKDADQLIHWARKEVHPESTDRGLYLGLVMHSEVLSAGAIEGLRQLGKDSSSVLPLTLGILSAHTSLTPSEQKTLQSLSLSRTQRIRALACLALTFDALRKKRDQDACKYLNRFLEAEIYSGFWLDLQAGLPFAKRLAKHSEVWKACSSKIFQRGVAARSKALARGSQWYRWQRLADDLALIQRGSQD